ncbi:MAG: helix-turn-helix transcriptional regulator [Alistipes sp.]|nr:helix-turn-helix transcriptional regulator [Alistipes sp.]
MVDYQIVLRDVTRRIKEVRRMKKLTVQEVAYRCNIERSNLSRIEAGRTNVTLKTLCIICTALEIKLTDIIK